MYTLSTSLELQRQTMELHVRIVELIKTTMEFHVRIAKLIRTTEIDNVILFTYNGDKVRKNGIVLINGGF